MWYGQTIGYSVGYIKKDAHFLEQLRILEVNKLLYIIRCINFRETETVVATKFLGF